MTSAAKGGSVVLSNGHHMPLIGLGTWLSKAGDVEKAVGVALEEGYRLIDTAQIYGNEAEIGTALKDKLSTGLVHREQLFLTTKAWVTNFTRKDITESLKVSLQKLGVDYVDLYLLHAPCPMKLVDGKPVPEVIDHLETWKGMEDAYNAGLTKAIGLSNFNPTQIRRIHDNASVKPHNLQVLLRWAMERGVAVIPKSVTAERIRENFLVHDFSFSPQELQQLNTLPSIRQRFFLQEWSATHPEDPFKDERHLYA